MRKILPGLVLGALAGGALSVMSAPVFAGEAVAPAAPKAPAAATAPAAGAAAAHYSVETTLVGKLLDDPAANEILKKMIPSVYGNDMFHSMGRDNTLKGIQQFEPEALSDANLAKLQAELNKIPAKN
jgi:para-nitrobenzyl esterase